ncbi:isochorismate synthase [Amycolatopsis jiangsuensis]|uniref:isochorismate synthase n=1 Tax=Amycolatopsis jiangsuensis TaxID=1181879 RepID=A0A840IQG8_9PSEU|nr:isochorismate synthase [Amycolatopsis jiangsuensis]MBB4684140.1 isochorismate synthase [Amycolatopsis jiangsuensis]
MPSPVRVRPRSVHGAADVLAAYLPGSFYYSSPRGALLADGVRTRVRTGAAGRGEAAAEALDEAVLAGAEDPIVVGAIGFRPDAPASLVVPAVVRWAGAPGTDGPRGGEEPVAGGGWSVVPRPAPEVYTTGVRRALELIGDGALRKVVLARSLELTAAEPVSVPRLLTRLVRADPAAHAFAADVTGDGDDAPRTLVGASPELLVSRRGQVVSANPLAGSRPRAGDAVEDERRIAELLASGKDRAEHAHVVAQVAEVLGRFCTDLEVPAEPEVIGTPTMWHLSTRVTGRTGAGGPSALALAEALHPTPAVCGVPAPLARDTIARLEPEDRGYYSGLVGWTGADGDGEWVVTIRCAEVSGRGVRLFAGAGVVEGSDPEAELAETSAKFRTLLRALDAEEAA